VPRGDPCAGRNALLRVTVIPSGGLGDHAGRTLQTLHDQATTMFHDLTDIETSDSQHEAWLATSEAGLDHICQTQAYGLGPDLSEAWASGWGRVLVAPFGRSANA
jgi:hypothetical protein